MNNNNLPLQTCANEIRQLCVNAGYTILGIVVQNFSNKFSLALRNLNGKNMTILFTKMNDGRWTCINIGCGRETIRGDNFNTIKIRVQDRINSDLWKHYPGNNVNNANPNHYHHNNYLNNHYTGPN